MHGVIAIRVTATPDKSVATVNVCTDLTASDNLVRQAGIVALARVVVTIYAQMVLTASDNLVGQAGIVAVARAVVMEYAKVTTIVIMILLPLLLA